MFDSRFARALVALLALNLLIAGGVCLGSDLRYAGRALAGLGLVQLLFGAYLALPLAGVAPGALAEMRLPSIQAESAAVRSQRNEMALCLSAIGLLSVAVAILCFILV